MSVEVASQTTVSAQPTTVWEFIADPAHRAAAISVVEDYELHDDGRATWHVEVPIPLLGQTIAVTTTELTRRPPEYVQFAGSAPGLEITGGHTLSSVAAGTQLHTGLTVAGDLPGTERYFQQQLTQELANIEAALKTWL